MLARDRRDTLLPVRGKAFCASDDALGASVKFPCSPGSNSYSFVFGGFCFDSGFAYSDTLAKLREVDMAGTQLRGGNDDSGAASRLA